jgi:PAS domain S-box-containing protein
MEPADLSKSRIGEAALREREAELARVQRIGRVGGFEIDLRGGRFENRRSPEYLMVHGLPPEAADEPHDAWVSRLHPDDRERVDTAFRNCVAGEAQTYEAEYRIIVPGGGVRWIAALGEIDRDSSGAALRMVGVHIDITRTKAAEDALRASELALKVSQQRMRDLNEGLEKLAQERARQLASSRAQLQAFFDNSPDWLTLQRCTPAGEFIYVDLNPACEAAYGVPRDRVIGRRVEEILGEEPAQLPISHFRECLRTGQPQRYVTHRTMAGVTRFIDVISALVPGGDDHGDRFLLTTARDLTEREELESKLRQAQKMEAIGQLTGGVAHDFNNLLTIIIGNASLIQRGSASDPARLAHNILTAGERGAALTRRLLSLSRHRPQAREIVDLKAELPKMTEMLRSSLRGDIDLQIDIDPMIRPVEVDLGELEIALLNVAVNARDAMPNGGRFNVDVRNQRSEGDGREFVAVALQDNGVGMPVTVMARASEPFFTTKELGFGTGLGLSQVYNFAQSSGGVTHLESKVGSGTRVTILLPHASGSMTSQPSSREYIRSQPLRGRVLLVDDNDEVMNVTKTMIGAMGLEVETANRASDALELLATRSNRFNLVLTDIVMPGMNGVDLAREIHSMVPWLPVLLMSGYNETADTHEYRVLRKPVPYDDLYDAILGSLRDNI